MADIILRSFTEEEYHQFFRRYRPDPVMDPSPFHYSYEQISRVYRYNFGGFRKDYAEYGIFLDNRPVGSFQLKRIDADRKTCEFGIILQNDEMKNKGIGTRAIQIGIHTARRQYGMTSITGETLEHNHRMIHIFEKLGFTLAESRSAPSASGGTILVYQLQLTEETA